MDKLKAELTCFSLGNSSVLLVSDHGKGKVSGCTFSVRNRKQYNFQDKERTSNYNIALICKAG